MISGVVRGKYVIRVCLLIMTYVQNKGHSLYVLDTKFIIFKGPLYLNIAGLLSRYSEYFFRVSLADETIDEHRLQFRTMSKQDDRGIFHFSYNLALEAEENNYPHKAGEDVVLLAKNSSIFRRQPMLRTFNQKDGNNPEKDVHANRSILYLSDDKSLTEPKIRSQFIFYGGAIQGYVQGKETDDHEQASVEETRKRYYGMGASRRKLGLGEVTNVSIMGHKLRKKAVCDITDNSHYQRQFLRVLNKRF